MEILRAVLALNEPADIKERTIFDISDKLQKEYVDLDTEEIVQTSHQFIIDELLLKEKEKAEIEKNTAIHATMVECDSNIQRMRNQSTEEQKSILEELKQSRKQNKIDIDNAKRETCEKFINQLVEKQMPKTLFLYWAITVLIGVLGIALLINGIYVALIVRQNIKEPYNDLYIQIIEMICSMIVPIVVGFVGKYVVDNIFCGLKSDEIEKKVRKKIERAHLRE